MVRICFVCLGNICRSPTAEAVMAALIEREGLGDQVEIDSSGTSGYHEGEPADARSRAVAKKRGYAVTSRSRLARVSDFETFDLLIAMDKSNHRNLLAIAPAGSEDRVRMLREFDPESEKGAEVPDPYYGGGSGFDDVLDICEAGCEGLLTHVKTLLDASA